MAFNEKELAIIRWGTENGKSAQEIKDAVFRFRTTGSPKDPNALVDQQPGPTFVEKVVEAAEAGVERIGQGIEQGMTTESPLGVIESGIKVGEGAVQTATAPLAPLLEPLQKMISFISGKIADSPKVQEFAESKAGEVTSRVAEDIAGLSTIAGASLGARAAPRVAGSASRIAQETIPSLQGIVETGAGGIQKAVQASADPAKIMQRVARVSKQKQVNFEKLAGKSVGQYLVDNGIFGNIDEITTQLFDRFQKSKSAADRAFEILDERTGQTYKFEPVKTALEELFAREKRTSSTGAVSPDLARIGELRRKFDSVGLSQTEINEVKRLYERKIKVDYLKENKPESVAKATNLDTAIRNWQRDIAEENGLTNIKEINKETQLAKQLVDDLGIEYAGSAGNNAITLTDWILISGLDPTAIGAFLAKKTISSKGVQSEIARRLAGKPEQTDIFPIFRDPGAVIDSYGDWISSIETKQ